MNTKKLLILSLVASTAVFGSGFKLTTSSLNSNALSAAYVAASHGADSSYYNPANMAFNADKHFTEYDLTYISVPQTEYTDTRSPLLNSTAEKEGVFIPSFHYASKDYDGIRYGFSLIVPAGMTRRWNDPLAKATAEEFSLKILELNPTIAYKVNEKFAIGGGLRVIKADAVVKSDSADVNAILGVGSIARDMKGDDISYGYNLALTYKPTPIATIAATYRSKINMKLEGDAKLYFNGAKIYDGSGNVNLPLPASLTLALAYKLQEKTTVEVVYEKTFWSRYKELDFEYESVQPIFEAPVAKDYKNTVAYRIGLTHQYNDKLNLMVGFAKDESPIPDTTIGFDLPGNDAKMASTGFNYKIDDRSSFGMSYLYTKKDDRTVTNGKFTNIKAHVFNVGYKVSF